MCGPFVLWFTVLLVVMAAWGTEAGDVFIFGTLVIGALWLWSQVGSDDAGSGHRDSGGGGGDSRGNGGGTGLGGDGDGGDGGGEGGGGAGSGG